MLAPVQTLRDLTEDVQLATRKAWRTLALGGEREPVRVPGPPIRLSDGAWEPRGAPPRVGEHNDEMFGAALTPGPSPAGAGEGSIIQPSSLRTPPLPSRREIGSGGWASTHSDLHTGGSSG